MLILTPLLASCATTAGRGIDAAALQRAQCAAWKPIYVASKDVLTDPTAKAILDHDRTGVELGCWKAPARGKKP